MRRRIALALVVLAALGRSAQARAGDGTTTTCGSKVARDNVVACAVGASLTVRAQKEATEAAKGRETAAEPVLPSSPVLSVTAAQRTSSGIRPLANWSVALFQEIEIAGQRGARQRAAGEGVAAEKQRTAATERDAALAAWRAYFEALGAKEDVRRAKKVEALAAKIDVAVTAGAQGGLAAGIDTELAGARLLQATQARLGAERAEKAAVVALATLWGRDPSLPALAVEGALTPLAGVEDFVAKSSPKPAADKPEALALEADKRALEARADELSRARVPNVTLSVFVQNDGVNELVVGAGLTIPIPLPQPVGRTNAGEIAEAEALARKAGTEAEAVRRAARGDVASAVSEYTSRKAEVDAFSAERLARAEASLANIAAEIAAGRYSLKDAAQAQQALVEVLAAHVQAQKALCLASIEVVRAAGLPIEGASK